MNQISVPSSSIPRKLISLAQRSITPALIRQLVAISAAVALALVFFATSAPLTFAAPPDCGLIQDCYMNGFYGNGTGAGSGPWKIFKIAGLAGIDLAPVEGWPSGPSVHLRGSNSPFDAGIYQTVAVTPGTGYHFEVAWAVEQVDGKGYQNWYQINRQLGIDPFGGKDATSPNVQWSSDYFANGKFDLAFDGYARASTMTVFIRVSNPYNDHVVDVYLDTATLHVNNDMAPISVAAPTATQPPAAPTNPPPTKPPATARPTRAPTQVAVEETATDEPTDTPQPSATIAPTDTVEPSDTPTKLPTRSRRATPTPAPAVEASTSTNFLALGLIGLTGLGGIVAAGILFALAFVYWRRARG